MEEKELREELKEDKIEKNAREEAKEEISEIKSDEKKIDWEARYKEAYDELKMMKSKMADRDKRDYRNKLFTERNVKPTMKEMLNRLMDTYGDDEEGFWNAIKDSPEFFNSKQEFNSSLKIPETDERKKEKESREKSGGAY